MNLTVKVKSIIADQFQRNPNLQDIDGETRFVDDCGADSLDKIELVMAFEEEFGINIPDVDMDRLETVGAVVEYLRDTVGIEDDEKDENKVARGESPGV
jgi:acyl carrier protein